MSSFSFELDEPIKNFTLNKLFKKLLEAYRSNSIEAVSTPLGSFYELDDGVIDAELYLDEKFAKDPGANEMRSEEVNSLYKYVMSGDNYIDCEWMNSAPGRINIFTDNGDDIINVETTLSQRTKRFTVDAGEGDDLIGCYLRFDDEFGTKRRPFVSFKGGKGSDTFVGVPESLIGYVKDFDIKNDSLGFDGDIKKHRFYATPQGLAVVDLRESDGMLILEGVQSIDQIKTVEVNIF